jgi:hypothetical protein
MECRCCNGRSGSASASFFAGLFVAFASRTTSAAKVGHQDEFRTGRVVLSACQRGSAELQDEVPLPA